VCESPQALPCFLRAQLLGFSVPNKSRLDVGCEPQFSQFLEYDGIIGLRKHERGAPISCFGGPLKNQSRCCEVASHLKGIATCEKRIELPGVDPARERPGGPQRRRWRQPFQALKSYDRQGPIGEHERDDDVHGLHKALRRHDGRCLDLRGGNERGILANELAGGEQ